MDIVKAFIVGGLICIVVQVLMDRTKLMPGRIMVILVTAGTVLGALGLYKYLVDYAGAGATVPLLGFGNLLGEGVVKAVDEYGFLGIFKGGMEVAAGGISAALIFGYLVSLVSKPKIRE